MPELQLAVIDVKPGAAMESQSGLQMLRPRIYGAFRAPPGPKRIAAIVMHPTSNFMGHYLIGPLAERGICCMGLNSRYVGNDTVLLMERAIQDLGAGVQYLRAAGYEKVFLVGNSGGAALSAFYQAQAEKLTATHLPDGDPTHLHPADLPPVDGIALCAAHLGRTRLMRDWIDPSVTDEHDPLSVDPELDMYDPRHRMPYDRGFLARFSAAQQARLGRIEQWCVDRLALLRSTRAHRATRPSSSTARMPIRAAWICRSMPTTACRAACGAMRARSTTRPMQWAAPPRSPRFSRNGLRARRPTAQRISRAPRCRSCC